MVAFYLMIVRDELPCMHVDVLTILILFRPFARGSTQANQSSGSC